MKIKNRKQKKSMLTGSEALWSVVEGYLINGEENRILEDRDLPKPPCMSLYRYFRLNPNGDVIPCSLKPTAVGNIKNSSFSEIWSCEIARLMRREVKICNGCWVECDILPSGIYSGDVIKWRIRRMWKK